MVEKSGAGQAQGVDAGKIWCFWLGETSLFPGDKPLKRGHRAILQRLAELRTDEGFAAANWKGSTGRRIQSGRWKRVDYEPAMRLNLGGVNHGILVLAKDLPCTPGFLDMDWMQKNML